MVCVQEVKRENSFGAQNGGWIPPNTQELPKFFEVPILGTSAETEADSVMSGKVDNEQLLDFPRNGAAVTRMSQVDD